MKHLLNSLFIILFFISAVTATGQTDDKLFSQAKAYYSAKDYQKTIELFSQLISQTPDKIDYYRWRGSAYYYLAKYNEALVDYNSAIQKSTDVYANDYSVRGQAYYALNSFDLALADFNMAIKIDKTKYYYFSWRAYTYQALGQTEKAIADLGSAIEIDATKDILFSYRAQYKTQLNDLTGALEDARKALSINPKDGSALLSAGVCYYRLQKYQLAAENYQKVYDLDPSTTNLANLSMGIARIGRVNEAVQNLNKVIEEANTAKIKMGIGYFYFMKARIYGFSNMKTEALSSMKLAFQNGFNSKSYSSYEAYYNELAPIHNDPEFLALTKQYNMSVPASYVSSGNPVNKINSGNQTINNDASNGLIDVDTNIPAVNKQNPYSFALIIGNEDYSSFQRDLNSEVNVDFASRDAAIFKEYTLKRLSIPGENIIFLTNAKSIEMDRAFRQIELLAKNSNGKAEIIFYYAGHGFPDEVTKDPFLIPVDVSANDLKYAFKLADIYKQLTKYPTKRVTVFLDACFSGGARNKGLISVRGIKVKPKENLLTGNLIVFSASSGDQSALPYKEKKHGMFTYFLLKKLQSSNEKLTYKELSDYISEQVGINAILINKKEQNAQTNTSINIANTWTNWGF